MASLKALAGRASQASDHVTLPAERLYRYSTSFSRQRATLTRRLRHGAHHGTQRQHDSDPGSRLRAGPAPGGRPGPESLHHAPPGPHRTDPATEPVREFRTRPGIIPIPPDTAPGLRDRPRASRAIVTQISPTSLHASLPG